MEANRRKILGLAAAKGQREARPRGSEDKNEATPVTTTERIKGEKDGRRSGRRERKIYIEREAVRRKGERERERYLRGRRESNETKARESEGRRRKEEGRRWGEGGWGKTDPP